MRPTPTPTHAVSTHGGHLIRYLPAEEAARLERQDALVCCSECSVGPASVYHLDVDGELCPTCSYPRVSGHCCPHCDEAALIAQEPVCR